MEHYRLDNMTKGWFVGAFEPTIHWTNDFEIAVKSYKKGDTEEKHYHRIATEITVVVLGSVVMFDKKWEEGDIIVAEPGDATSFEALSDTINVVVKVPSVGKDKYLV